MIPDGENRLMGQRRRAAGVIVWDGRVLMVREREAQEVWTLPGGGIEPGETPAQAVLREVAEETGLTAVSARYLFEAPYPSGMTSVHAVEVADPGAPLAAGAEWVPLPDVTPSRPGHPIPLLIVVTG
jgi:8-oxo-dGTP diphosphatase